MRSAACVVGVVALLAGCKKQDDEALKKRFVEYEARAYRCEDMACLKPVLDEARDTFAGLRERTKGEMDTIMPVIAKLADLELAMQAAEKAGTRIAQDGISVRVPPDYARPDPTKLTFRRGTTPDEGAALTLKHVTDRPDTVFSTKDGCQGMGKDLAAALDGAATFTADLHDIDGEKACVVYAETARGSAYNAILPSKTKGAYHYLMCIYPKTSTVGADDCTAMIASLRYVRS